MKERFETLQVHSEQDITYIQLYRPNENNTINNQLINECLEALEYCSSQAKIVVMQGLPEVFCFGADFKEIDIDSHQGAVDPEPLYELWHQLATGPFVSIAQVRGKVNAGGIGFVAACDVVICEKQSVFSLSELLFGLIPACVMPFLIRRIGQAKANYMTLMTQPIEASQALDWGLVDAVDDNTNNLLRKHLLRLRRLDKNAIARSKTFIHDIALDDLNSAKQKSLTTNHTVFADRENQQKIIRFRESGQFPWE